MLTSVFVLTFFYNFSFPTLNIQAQSNEKNNTIKYICEVSGSDIINEDIIMHVTPKINAPEEVEANSEFTITDVTADISIQLAGTILEMVKGLINPFNGHANEFIVNANGEETNIVGEDGVAFPETPLGDDDETIDFTVEANDYTIKADEEDITIKAENIEASIITSIAELPVTCEPEGDTHVATVSVVEAGDEEDPGNGEGEDEGNGDGEDEGNGDGEDEENGDGEDEGNGDGEDEGNGDGEDEGNGEGEEVEHDIATSVEYACTVQNSSILDETTKIKMIVSPTMNVPESMKPNSQYMITDVKTDISIDLTGVLNDLRALINPFNGHANSFTVDAGENKGINIVGKNGAPFPETPHSANDEAIHFEVPGNDYKVISSEDDVELHVGNINADIESSLATLTVSCDPIENENTLVDVIPIAADGVGDPITEGGGGSGSGDGTGGGSGSGDGTGGGSGSGDGTGSGSGSGDGTGGGSGSGDGTGGGSGSGVGTGGGSGSTGDTGGVDSGGSTLPKTATDNPLFITVGAMLVALGGAMSLVRRKRQTT